MSIPNKIFIVPYRDREQHKLHFDLYMKYILEDIPEKDYKRLRRMLIEQEEMVLDESAGFKD